MDYDVIICGAGPSGATSAKFLAEKGYKIALLDRYTFPRDKSCGGALRLSIDEYGYIMEGMKDISLTNSFEVRMYSPSLEHIAKFRSDKPVMLQIKRHEFDAMVVNKAEDAGAYFMENKNVKEISISKNKGTVILKNGDELTSHLIIGAGGMHDVPSRYLRNKHGLPSTWQKSEIALLMMHEYKLGEEFIDDAFGGERTSHIFLKPYGIYGYGWAFPKDDVLNLGFGAFWNDMKKIDIQKAYDSFLRFLGKQGLFPRNQDRDRVGAATLPMSGPIKRTYSDRIMIIGDAAGFVSPLSGDGIYYAISSGEFAAATAIESLESELFDSNHLKSYQNRWQKAWGMEIAVLKSLASALNNQTERFIRYISLDAKLREHVQDIYTGRKDPSKLIWKIAPIILKDFVRFETK